MRKLFLLACLAPVITPAHADIWDLYDGAAGASAGVTCNYYNKAAKLLWRNLGGDWSDRDGDLQGELPYDTVQFVNYQKGSVQLDVTQAVKDGKSGLVLRKTGAPLKFHSSETDNGPRLLVTRSDGSVVVLKPRADATSAAVRTDPLRCASVTPTGESVTISPAQAAFIEFPPLPPSFVSAVLELTIARSYGSSSVGVYALNRPNLGVAPLTTGLANQYPNDKGICKDSRVLYCEDWDTDPKNWWTRTGTAKLNIPSTWAHVTNGVSFPTSWFATSYEPGAGVLGAALRIEMQADTLSGTRAPTVDFVSLGLGEQEHLFYRYYVKFSPEFRDAPGCTGGKLPGMSGTTSIAGNAGGAVDGTNGWSLRGAYHLNCDKHNPIYPRVVIGTYAYHGDMTGSYGNQWAWVGRGDAGLTKLNEWYCVEGEVRVNTPGIRDGVFRGWINGRLAYQKTNLYLRASSPYQVDGDLGIRKFWGTVHHGGKSPLGKQAALWIDQTVVAKNRIGCLMQ